MPQPDDRITVGHFFAGGGGGVLDSEILGHESVFALDINQRRCRVLRESGWFPRMYVECTDIREFDSGPWQGRMDCIAAGFPCQDISATGKGAGVRGAKSGLVWGMFEAIDAIRPSILFLENSPYIRTRGRRDIIRAIVERGYSWRDGTLAAAHVGAGHKRNRWWCLAANADGKRKLEQERCVLKQWQRTRTGSSSVANSRIVRRAQGQPELQTPQVDLETECRHSQTANLEEFRRNKWRQFVDSLERAVLLGGLDSRDAAAIAVAAAYTATINWSPPDAGIRRVVDGMADRMDRIKTCGDGQVPLQAATAWMLLAGWNLS